jgi:catechol 2,3-dioxygenase-like lactoylglutathione lyase family enzyme
MRARSLAAWGGSSGGIRPPTHRRSRRCSALECLAGVALALWLVATPSARPADVAAPFAAESVESVGLTVSNLESSTRFFTDALGFTVVGAPVELEGRPYELLHGVFGARVRTSRLRLGSEFIELTEYLAPRGRPYPVDTHGNDRWFQHIAIITSDMTTAYERLRSRGAAHASTAPQRLPDWNPGAGGIQAYYFRDADGHFLEVLQFPPGKGDPRWQAKGALFLGIDHTAIVVDDTDKALAFYRDGLGLAVAGQGENYGEEQEHLNNVFGARLRITTLRARSGPGIELLHYLAPRDGRPTPLDLKANDLAHWQTTVRGADPRALLARQHGGGLVSPDVVAVDASSAGFARGLMLRDPDGHAIRAVAR